MLRLLLRLTSDAKQKFVSILYSFIISENYDLLVDENGIRIIGNYKEGMD